MAISRFALATVTGLFVAGIAGSGFAQGVGHGGGGGMSASTVGSGGASATPNSASGTVGTGGSAAAGSTSATSLGLGAQSTTPTQSSSSLSTGGSAAAGDNGHVMSKSGVHGNSNNLNGQSMNQAHEPGGEWSKSHTHTKVHKGELSSRTKSMAHEPGGPPVKSTTRHLGRSRPLNDKDAVNTIVFPAKAETRATGARLPWTPAFAGVTMTG